MSSDGLLTKAFDEMRVHGLHDVKCACECKVAVRERQVLQGRQGDVD